MAAFKTKLVRFTFVHLAEPHAFAEGMEAKYSINVLIDKNDKETLERIAKAYKEAVQEGVEKFGATFKGKATPIKREPGSTKGILIDCDADEKYNGYPECKGHYMLAAKSNNPVSVGFRKAGVTYAFSNKEEIAQEVYSGSYGAVSVNLYPYNRVGSGIAAGLNSVLKVKDGEPLGGHSNVTSDFADFDDDQDDDNDISELL